MKSQTLVERLELATKICREKLPWQVKTGDDWFDASDLLTAIYQDREIRLKPFVPEPPEGYRLLTEEEKKDQHLGFGTKAVYWSNVQNGWMPTARADRPWHIAVSVEPVPAYDGWIEWRGGECPVAPEARVSVRFRNGSESSAAARKWRWHHAPWRSDRERDAFDIIAYRIEDPVPPAPEYVPWTFETFPKDRVVWVKPKEGPEVLCCIKTIHPHGLDVADHCFIVWGRLWDHWTQYDNTPCGTLKQ